MNRPIIIYAIMILGTLSSGCARIEKVKVLASDPSMPYESLGTLEVKTQANRRALPRLGWTTVEMMTLSLAKTPTRGETYKRRLNQKLSDKASEHYDADAIIHPEYWPDPESSAFPEGQVYARGEMIRYRKFAPS